MAALKRWPCGNLYRTAALRLGPHRKGVATSRPYVIHNRWVASKHRLQHNAAIICRSMDLFDLTGDRPRPCYAPAAHEHGARRAAAAWPAPAS